jgi:predicted regulator of Ras-like GTPase activity (Roadblock/LC7/MglB family)/ribosomal protein L40E
MIICSNCGATNNEADGHICRKCGALLPISNKTTRNRIATKKKQKETSKKSTTPKEKEVVHKSADLDLQDIPLQEEFSAQNSSVKLSSPSGAPSSTNCDTSVDTEEFVEQKEILKEITPQPFQGSIIVNKSIYGAKTMMESKSKSDHENISEGLTTELESSVLKQKQLEKDMTKVLKFLSKKVTVKPLDELKETTESKEKAQPQIPPSSMNEILTNLLKLDVNIEASAIIQKDGTILASAISSRISDSLFATIAQNLSMIGGDIVDGLNAGNLQNISIRGSEGVLDLAPIDTKGKVKNEMVLIVFSHPKVKSGIIHLAASMVKKQVIQYLGLGK